MSRTRRPALLETLDTPNIVDEHTAHDQGALDLDDALGDAGGVGAQRRPRRSGKGIAPSRAGKHGVLIFLDTPTWRALKMMALDQETSMQALGADALAELTKTYRR